MDNSITHCKQGTLCEAAEFPECSVSVSEASTPTQEAEAARIGSEAVCDTLELDNAGACPDEISAGSDAGETQDGDDNHPVEETKPTNHEVIVMTFEEYDKFMEQAADIELYNCQPYWPTSGDLELHQQDFPLKQMILFLSWLLEMNGKPCTDTEKRSHKAMQQFVYERLQLVEELPKPPARPELVEEAEEFV